MTRPGAAARPHAGSAPGAAQVRVPGGGSARPPQDCCSLLQKEGLDNTGCLDCSQLTRTKMSQTPPPPSADGSKAMQASHLSWHWWAQTLPPWAQTLPPKLSLTARRTQKRSADQTQAGGDAALQVRVAARCCPMGSGKRGPRQAHQRTPTRCASQTEAPTRRS
jgi:hypothetical protein